MSKCKRASAIVLLAIAIATTGCSGWMGGNGGSVRNQTYGTTPKAGPGQLFGDGMRLLSVEDGRIPFEQLDGKSYVSVHRLATLLEFMTDWDEASGRLRMGAHDAEYELTAGRREAVKGDTVLALADVPKTSNGQLYLPVDLIPDLFADEVFYELRDGELVLGVNPEEVGRPSDLPDGEDLDEPGFGDDPEDPAREVASPAGTVPLSSLSGAARTLTLARYTATEAIPAAAGLDSDKLITNAKRYLGVVYKFGAAPYAQSGKFDCSTFTQHLFGKQGVELPRTARAQAERGSRVSRSLLRKGDLLFFYVPGRFKTNKTVGHVGIYMGNGQMIHSSPEPKDGVQVTNINEAYWKKTFLRAKRVGS